MRARMLFLVLAILAVGGFAAQNWPEITRPSNLTFGVMQADAPLGLILLTLLGLTLLVFLSTAASMRSRNMAESRRLSRDLHAQRELAEKAEASRFTDLRQLMDGHLRDIRQHETVVNTEMEKAMAQHQRELRNQLEQMYHLLTSRLTELERRLDARAPRMVERVEPVAARTGDPLHTPGRERV